MKTHPLRLLFLFLFLASTSLALAQGVGAVRVGIAGSADFPVQDQGDAYKTGWNGTLLIPINFGTSPVSLRVDGSYGELRTKNLPLLFPESGRARIISGTADVVVGPRGHAVEPYFIGGVGAYDLRFQGQGSLACPPPAPGQFQCLVIGIRQVSDTTTRFGWNVGGGIALPLGASSSRLFVEARYISISTSADPFSNAIRTGSRFTFVPMNIGFIF